MARPLEIPPHSGPIGPVTARLQRRWVVGYFALWTGSLLLLRRTKSEAARTAAAGLVLPGGGYLYSGRTARFALVIRDRILGPNGRPVFQSRILDPLDPGDYRPSWGPLTYGFGLAAARELGDDETCTALEASLAEVAPLMATEGVSAYPGTVMANLMQGLGRFGGERALHDLVTYGLPGEQRRGPLLADAPYPQVLVARAVSSGPSLDLVLYPGTARGEVTLELSQLLPDRRYRVGGADRCVTSDTEGRARVSFPLDGRVALTITPTDA